MLWLWIGFIVFVLVMLALDLGVFNRHAHVVSAKEATKWVVVFVAIALAFNVCVYFIYANNWLGIGERHARAAVLSDTAAEHVNTEHIDRDTPALIFSGHELGKKAAQEFFAGWLTEYALSVDNIFVISLIFGFFAVPGKYQHRVLFWGILGALIFRGVMIGLGAELVRQFEWVLLLFGAFLFVQGIKLLKPEEEDFDPEKSSIVRLTKSVVPVSNKYEEQKFFTRIEGKLFATPLLLVLLIVEFTDVIFAVDSIPAIFGITRDPFLVFTSNVFAIMGLRSLYFALASLLDKFHYLHYSLAVILAGVGVKMLVENAHHVRMLEKYARDCPGLFAWLPNAEHPIHVPSGVWLGMIVGSLALGMGASLVYARKHAEETRAEHEQKAMKENKDEKSA